ncbi:S-adenosyl-L-methionine-dependent methyltransferase [Parathielavia hyrcaniae]|uniref:S-adenosyl-L-methionine-dependent methyltransferase n=1 Tax=Parathielavia hyrcaniae TaxID=113614 RepID=A0AAN6PVF9_9PEZI|nr:S-adenosyl-L-methionine-dependent methyltransferase [Parathielavia hyrcaniae]
MATKSGFDLVLAAESLRHDAGTLAGILETTHDGEDSAAHLLRRRIVQTAKMIAFETAPKVDVVKEDWIVLGNVAAWNIFIDWKAFDHIPVDGYIYISELARVLNAQESLVARISAQLFATGKLLPGPYPNTLSHSRISPLYISTHPVSDACTVAVGNAMKPFAHWPEYFRAYGRREPVGPAHTPFSFAWGHAALPPWEVKALHPAYASAFMRTMRARQIAGGDMVVAGKRALCDLGWVERRANLESGAAVYLLRRILCDYSDELAIGILSRLAEALPDHKPRVRVIIMEERLLEVPTPENCIVDMVMANLGGKLRNEATYREIAAAAGLRVVGYHVQEGQPLCAVECAKI